MPSSPPLNIDKRSRISNKLPGGTVVPLAWDFATGKPVAKVASGFPWNDEEATKKLIDAGGQYLADNDEWFRGVWVPAPDNVFAADYNPDAEKQAEPQTNE